MDVLREAIPEVIADEQFGEDVGDIKFEWGRPTFSRDDTRRVTYITYPVIVRYNDGGDVYALSTDVEYEVGDSSSDAVLRSVGTDEGFYGPVGDEPGPTDDVFDRMNAAIMDDAASDDSLDAASEDYRDLY